MRKSSPLLSEPIEAVVFDMDGTLIDSEAVFRAALFHACTDLGFEMTHDIHARILGGTADNTKQVLADTYGVAFPFRQFYDRCAAHIKNTLEETPIRTKPGAEELIRFLDKKSIPMAVATSSRLVHASSHLKSVGFLPFFQTLVTREDVTFPKPHPEPYLKAAQRLSINPARCIAFEDSTTGVRAATAAGMRTILVPDLQRPADDVASLCALVLDSLTDAHVHLVDIFAEAA